MISLVLSLVACAPQYDRVQQKAWVMSCIGRNEASCASISEEWLGRSENSNSKAAIWSTRCRYFWTQGECLKAGREYERRYLEQEKNGWSSLGSRLEALTMYETGCEANPGKNPVCQSYRRFSDMNLVEYTGKALEQHEASMAELDRVLGAR